MPLCHSLFNKLKSLSTGLWLRASYFEPCALRALLVLPRRKSIRTCATGEVASSALPWRGKNLQTWPASLGASTRPGSSLSRSRGVPTRAVAPRVFLLGRNFNNMRQILCVCDGTREEMGRLLHLRTIEHLCSAVASWDAPRAVISIQMEQAGSATSSAEAPRGEKYKCK